MDVGCARGEAEVTVITLTRARPEALVRAIDSVAAQSGVRIRHIVVGDDCDFLKQASSRAELSARYDHLEIVNVPRSGEVDYLPIRLAELRNLGARLARSEYVAQLDDDNRYESEHLRSLIDAIRRRPGAEAAYSWRRLFDASERPFVPVDADPWAPHLDHDGELFGRLQRTGILTPGSNIVRDRLETDGETLPRVDSSEFMVTRRLHDRCPWPTTFSRGARRLGFTEDLAFSIELVRRGVAVACSNRPTLRYYMGGYSNRAGVEPAGQAGSGGPPGSGN